VRIYQLTDPVATGRPLLRSAGLDDHPGGHVVLVVRWGSWLMGIAAAGFIGYAMLFLVRNSTDSFLELGIGPNEVPVG
jgi:hypothetical protein